MAWDTYLTNMLQTYFMKIPKHCINPRKKYSEDDTDILVQAVDLMIDTVRTIWTQLEYGHNPEEIIRNKLIFKEFLQKPNFDRLNQISDI